MSNILIKNEEYFILIISTIAVIWSLILLINGMSIIHEYSIKKVIASLFFTVIGVAIMAFLCLLAMSLMGQIVLFFSTVWKEISFSI